MIQAGTDEIPKILAALHCCEHCCISSYHVDCTSNLVNPANQHH